MLHTTWTYQSDIASVETVLPDGCRDIIVVQNKDAPDTVFVSDLDMAPRKVVIKKGRKMTGYRLQPGLNIPSAELLKNFDQPTDESVSDLLSIRPSDLEMAEIVNALALEDAPIVVTARRAGVSERTLLRRFRQANLGKPVFWRSLGRARRAAAALSDEIPLAHLAFSTGYSDQAHMTREFIRWFGCPPAHLRKNRTLLEQVRQPGLGTWTGEQISTR